MIGFTPSQPPEINRALCFVMTDNALIFSGFYRKNKTRTEQCVNTASPSNHKLKRTAK